MKKSLQGQFRDEATFKLVHGTDFHVSSRGTSLRSLDSIDGNGPCPASGSQSIQQLISQLLRAGFKGLAGGSPPLCKALCLADLFSPSLQLYAEQ